MAPQNERLLNLSSSYPCPVCRQGKLEAIVLTDAFSCTFCRHILAANLEAQQVQIVDSTQPLTWSWNGEQWRLVRGENAEGFTRLVIFTAVVLTIVPAGLVWLSGSIFPPLEPQPHITFSTAWAVVTLLAHLTFVLWLVGEYYQIPFYVAAKVRILRRRLSSRP
ncbi:hypothetical protein PN498_25600 [Oscillatoria sp. CS-180]|uniref:hypothetical protein n=1 Tax=Oscillatoria sp. CS-180 TaxID=3021720 RepID=UPI0023302CA0|nr:hypothetical protein [Oscillatoria sp. CS-180]MDB9529392.1 hypothetical protein [Oscillatoria sp. CS-180]